MDESWFEKAFDKICIVGFVGYCIYLVITHFVIGTDKQEQIINQVINKTVTENEVVVDNNTREVLYKGKPFTGTIETENNNGEVKVKDGKPLCIEKSYQNGYRMKEYPDRTKEYYDYNGNRITAKEFEEGIAR